jgi:hypothetical protein
MYISCLRENIIIYDVNAFISGFFSTDDRQSNTISPRCVQYQLSLIHVKNAKALLTSCMLLKHHRTVKNKHNQLILVTSFTYIVYF